MLRFRIHSKRDCPAVIVLWLSKVYAYGVSHVVDDNLDQEYQKDYTPNAVVKLLPHR